MIQVYYGDGKGKTTAAIGQGIRALGNHYKVIMIQFLKNENTCECKFLKHLEPDFTVFHFEKKHKFSWDLTNEEKKEIALETSNALNFAAKVIDAGQCDILILDEVLNSIALGLANEEDVCELMDSIIEDDTNAIELILTGNTVPSSIAKRADYLSNIVNIKHPIDKGIGARKGIEY